MTGIQLNRIIDILDRAVKVAETMGRQGVS